MSNFGEIIFADTIENAAHQLAGDNELTLIAGATWAMRADLRHEARPKRYLALSRITALREIVQCDKELSIGAMATHAQIAAALKGDLHLRGLKNAASNSANPGVRRLATLGGNICAFGFAAGDLVPALLALDAVIEIMQEDRTERLPLFEFLAQRSQKSRALVIRAIIAIAPGTGAHARLTMRAAGDYPVAIASVWMSDDLQIVRIAIGSVEAEPRRWTALEQALAGAAPDPAYAQQIAKAHLEEIAGRDAVDVKGSYRVHVLPVLVGRAMAELAQPLRTTA